MAASVDFDRIAALRQEWTDTFVRVNDRPELQRFAKRIGRVVTVNCNAKAIVDFADGAWYDIALEFLHRIPDEEAKGKYDASKNSAQPLPPRQG